MFKPKTYTEALAKHASRRAKTTPKQKRKAKEVVRWGVKLWSVKKADLEFSRGGSQVHNLKKPRTNQLLGVKWTTSLTLAHVLVAEAHQKIFPKFHQNPRKFNWNCLSNPHENWNRQPSKVAYFYLYTL